MASYEARVRSIEKIIGSGYVRHDQIRPALEKAGLSQIDPDEVSDLVKVHKYRGAWWARGKVIGGAKTAADKIGSYVSAVVGAGVVAEVMAAREFAGTLIGDKLQGFGDNLLYWLGLKSIEITGPEMMYAMGKVVAATPEIVKGMAIGAAVGYVLWKVITRAIGYSLRRSKRRKDIRKLLDSYGLTGGEEAQ